MHHCLIIKVKEILNTFFHVYAVNWLWLHDGYFFGILYCAFTLVHCCLGTKLWFLFLYSCIFLVNAYIFYSLHECLINLYLKICRFHLSHEIVVVNITYILVKLFTSKWTFQPLGLTRVNQHPLMHHAQWMMSRHKNIFGLQYYLVANHHG